MELLRPHRRVFVTLLVVITLGLLGVYYYQSKSLQPINEVKPQSDTALHDSATLRLSLIPSVGNLPFYYAVRSGLADSSHLRISIHTVHAQPDADSMLRAQHVDVAVLPLSYVAMTPTKTPLVGVMVIPETWQLIASKQLRATATNKLKGKLVATTRYATDDFWLYMALKNASLQFEDVYHPQINAIDTRTRMVINNQIDATILPEPWAYLAIRQGCKSLWKSNKLEQQWVLALHSHTLNKQAKREKISQLINLYAQASIELNRSQNTLRDTLFMELFHMTPTEVSILPPQQWGKPLGIREGDAKAIIDFLNTRGVTISTQRHALYSNALIAE